MKHVILFLLLTSPGLIFAEEISAPAENSQKGVKKTTSRKLSRYSTFMPGSFGLGFGFSDSSEKMDLGRAVDFHLMYFPFRYVGMGAFYQYDEFKNVNESGYNAEQTQGGLEVLFKTLEKPIFLYVGPFVGKGRFNRLNQRITSVDDESSLIYGGIIGATYAFNDAFSLGPSLRYIHLTNAQGLNTLSAKLEFQYRFVIY